MPAVASFGPPLLLVVGALLTWLFGFVGLPGRWPAVAGAWLALAALIVAWLAAGRQPAELAPPFSTNPVPLVLHLDAVSFAFGVIVLVPAGLLLTFQPRGWKDAGTSALATGFAMVALEAGALVLAALALGACAALVTIVLRREHEELATSCWLSVLLASFLLLWAAAAVETLSGGTSLYTAVPVSAFKVQVFALIAVAACLCSGLQPWRTWVSEVWQRPRLEGAGLALVLLVPLGFLLLVRTYTLGGGNWPAGAGWLHWLLAALGGAVALAAALRAQAAPDRRSELGEVVPLAGGLALLALSLGTPLGLAASVTGVAAAAVSVALGALLPAGGRVTLLGVPLVAGGPPGLTFGARLLTVQAALESGARQALWAIVIGAAWFLGYAAAARAAWLPAGSGRGSRAGAFAAAGVMLGAGASLAAIVLLVAMPAAAEAMRVQPAGVTGGYGSILSASGGYGALPLSIPMLVLLVVLGFFTRPLPMPAPLPRPSPPLLRLPRLPMTAWGQRLRARAGGLGEVLAAERLEKAMAEGHPWFWIAVALLLVVVVTR